MNEGYFLVELNDKTISDIFRIAFNEQPEFSWLIFVVFSELEKFMEIEGDFDGCHIKIGFEPLSSLREKLKQYDYSGEPCLWQSHRVDKAELLGVLLGKKLARIDYGIDKLEFIINGNLIKGERNLFTFIRFHFDDLYLTIQEGGSGLYISDNPDLGPFEETFDCYSTK